MNISLINQYKIPFIVNRIFQTFFGGLEIKFNTNNDDIRFKSSIKNGSIIKILVYLFPTTIGLISSIMIDNSYIDSYLGVLITVFIGFVFTLMMNIMPQISSPGSNKTSPLWSPNLVIKEPNQLFPMIIKYHSSMFILTRSILSSSLLGMMIQVFKLKFIKIHVKADNFISLLIFILAWFTFTTAHHSLIVGSPPETTIYSIKYHQFDCFNRPLYLMIMLLPLIMVFNFEQVTTTSSSYPLIMMIIICCLPFMWLFGILPPILVLFHYFLERINVILLGGTASCSLWSLLVTLIFSFSAIFFSNFYSNQFFLINTMAAFLVSHKWLINLNHLYRWRCFMKMFWSINFIILLSLIPINQINFIENLLFKLLLANMLIIYLVKYFKQVYLFNIIKNPLYLIMSPKLVEQYHSSPVFISSIRILLHFCLPVITLTIISSQISREEIIKRIENLNAHNLLLNILVFRMFRQCWQHPQTFSFKMILIRLFDQQPWPNLINLMDIIEFNYQLRWPLEAKFFLIDLIFNFLVNLSRKFYMFATILFSSVMIRKQKIKYSWTIFAFNVIWMPVNFSIIIISSFLNTPILPLFTLPIFFLSFPRPIKFWSSTPIILLKNEIQNDDSIYYRQFLPRFIDSIHKKSLFWDFRVEGEFFLARFDDRLMWIQILESGHNYLQIQMKGLELQETSCHTIEASIIDQMIEHSFQHSLNDWCGKMFNQQVLYSINPIMKIQTKTYSDAKSILTGIIDQPETFGKIRKIFGRVFIWLLLQWKINSIMEIRKINQNNIPVSVKESQINILVSSETKDSVGLETEDSEFNYDDLRTDPQWLNIIQQYSRRKSIQININQMNPLNSMLFSIEWFQKVLKVLTNNRDKLDDDEVQSLMTNYNHIANVCYKIVFPTKHLEPSTMAQNIYELYNGLLIKDRLDEKLFMLTPDLYHLCTKCFQYSTKIAFDQIIFDEKNIKDKDLIQTLKDFDKNWYFGPCKTINWNKAVLQEKLHLFCISKDLIKENYQSNLLTLKNNDVFLFQMNRDVIEAIWSSLSFELIYLTNDDEERYSIQAHQYIFRNLTAQAADLPLGYPVYVSEPILINHF